MDVSLGVISNPAFSHMFIWKCWGLNLKHISWKLYSNALIQEPLCPSFLLLLFTCTASELWGWEDALTEKRPEAGILQLQTLVIPSFCVREWAFNYSIVIVGLSSFFLPLSCKLTQIHIDGFSLSRWCLRVNKTFTAEFNWAERRNKREEEEEEEER